METLVFATHNHHKAKEIKNVLKGKYHVVYLTELDLYEEIPETGDTLQENALIKARYVFEKTGKACFADDTGLEVAALNGAPGVYSARYAGEKASFEDNINKLLLAMEGINNRRARFRTVMAYIDNQSNEHLFEGKVEGVITTQKRGEQGFGYDPVFLPDGYQENFAEMSAEEKNRISHRAKAVQQLVKYLKSI